MSKTYFISDLHFNHKNILQYEPCRIDATIYYIKNVLKKDCPYTKEEILDDFKTDTKSIIYWLLDYHDEMLIYNWNKKVKNTDTVWFLGDLGFGNKEYIKRCVSKLNGDKRMIKGNHDNLPDDYYREIGFSYVSKYPILLKNFFVLSHHPLEWMNPASSPFFFIYGHVHSMPQYQTKTENSRCVCVERQFFDPIEIEEFNQYQPNDDIDPHKDMKGN